MRENNGIRKAAAYVVLGINKEWRKEVLSITIGENESAKFWLSVLNELKNRGVQDIFVGRAERLSGIREAISAAYAELKQSFCVLSTPALTERRGNAMLFSPTAMGIRSFFASPSAIHFSIFPATCQGQAAKAVAAFAVIRRRNLGLRKSCAYCRSSAYRKS